MQAVCRRQSANEDLAAIDSCLRASAAAAAARPGRLCMAEAVHYACLATHFGFRSALAEAAQAPDLASRSLDRTCQAAMYRDALEILVELRGSLLHRLHD